MTRMTRRFLKDADGIAAIEFALILPVMFIIFFGVVEVSNLLSEDRRVTRVASTVADLVAQDNIVTVAELEGIFEASSAIMGPPEEGEAQVSIVVTSIVMDEDGDIEVDWSRAKNGTPRGTDDVSPPDGILEPNTSVILAETSFEFSPLVAVLLDAHYTLEDEFYLRPRRSLRVQCDDC